jgi:hypothetical protein
MTTPGLFYRTERWWDAEREEGEWVTAPTEQPHHHEEVEAFAHGAAVHGAVEGTEAGPSGMAKSRHGSPEAETQQRQRQQTRSQSPVIVEGARKVARKLGLGFDEIPEEEEDVKPSIPIHSSPSTSPPPSSQNGSASATSPYRSLPSSPSPPQQTQQQQGPDPSALRKNARKLSNMLLETGFVPSPFWAPGSGQAQAQGQTQAQMPAVQEHGEEREGYADGGQEGEDGEDEPEQER